jgi:hypothetical protein
VCCAYELWKSFNGAAAACAADYLGRSNWNMVSVWFYVTVFGSYTSPMSRLWTYLPVLLVFSMVWLAYR